MCAFCHACSAGATLCGQPAECRNGPHACDAGVQGACLLVGVDKDEGVPQLLLIQNGMELLCRRADALRVAAVHHIDDGLRAWDQSQGCISIAYLFYRAVKALPTILMHVEALLPARSEHKDLSCGLTMDTYMHLPSMRLGCWYDSCVCSGPAVQAWA